MGIVTPYPPSPYPPKGPYVSGVPDAMSFSWDGLGIQSKPRLPNASDTPKSNIELMGGFGL